MLGMVGGPEKETIQGGQEKVRGLTGTRGWSKKEQGQRRNRAKEGARSEIEEGQKKRRIRE